jgi:hypothetical protein
MEKGRSIIAQSSLTYAYKGESILRANGIGVRLVRLSGNQSQKGCGYGLAVSQSELPRAVLLLRQSGAFVGEIIR